jgi:hypothetical protein|tara:strand:+ start:184 stop:396 length:213 start_codon:yes stop_codon:yes gene_type:complete
MFKRKKSKKTQEETPVVEEVTIEVEAPKKKATKVKKEVVQPQSFRSLRAAKKYAKENGGKVIEKGRFYVR